MRNKYLYFSFVLTLLSAVSLYTADKAESLTMNKCGSCHKTGKFCKHLGTKDAAGWAKVVDGMVKKGAKINDDEKKTITGYLSKLSKGAKPVCN